MPTKSKLSLLFLGKKGDDYCQKALSFITRNFADVTVYLGDWGEPFPQGLLSWEGDYIVSYLSRWIVPEELINRSRKAAINFHPASPDYPGIGCNNFALYENAKEYGVTCHHMQKRVDTGSIISAIRFPVFPSDDVASLLTRTYQFQLVLFYQILGKIINGEALPESHEHWTRKPFSRKEFNAICTITPDMSQEEIARRIRATNYGPWKPSINFGGCTFELKSDG